MKIDFVEIAHRFEKLSKGQKAELRRVASPEDVAMIPAFYRLFPGMKTDARWRRLAYFVSYIKHASGSETLGGKLAKADISEARLFQVIRSESPNDLIQLRRLVQQVEPALDWQRLGTALFFWGKKEKQRLLEDYFMNHTEKKEKAT